VVPDGTEVYFDTQYGFVDEVVVETRRGEASTQAHLYEYARNYPGEAEVEIVVGDLRTSMGLDCAPPADPCGPDASPPCPTPTPCVVGPMSPPCITPTPTICEDWTSPPCGTPPCGPGPDSPPCPTPVPPCGPGPDSPPCPTPVPPITDCLGAAAPSSPDARFNMYVEATESDGLVTALVGINSTGGSSFSNAEWELCYPDELRFMGATRAFGAPVECELVSDNRPLTSLACIGADALLTSFGDMWRVTYACTAEGVIDLRLDLAALPSEVHEVPRSNALAPVSYDNATVECTAALPTPTPTNTPKPGDTSAIFSVDADPSVAGIQATRGAVAVGQNFTVDVVLSGIVPGYDGYQIGLNYDDVQLDPLLPPRWEDAPITNLSSGTPPGASIWPSGSTCVPNPAQAYEEDDTFDAEIAMACLSVSVSDITTYQGVLATFVFKCEIAGVGELALQAVDGTFLLDKEFVQHNDGISNATVTCIDIEVVPPVVEVITPTPTENVDGRGRKRL